MRCINSGHIGRYKTPDSGLLNPSMLQQFKSGFSFPVKILVVGGGGGGRYGTAPESGGGGNGGGAGGVIYQDITLTKGTTYTVTVGAGGASGTTGSSSVFGSLTASGGGGNGGYCGNGTPLQGFPGGRQVDIGQGCGGGGAGTAGTDGASGGYAGSGGNGISINITGTSTYFAGGGGGGGYSGGGSGGLGGGASTNGAGTANTGGGGGGGAYNSGQAGGAGGSGTEILRILTSLYSGLHTGSPVVTTDGLYTIVKWNSTGTYTA